MRFKIHKIPMGHRPVNEPPLMPRPAAPPAGTSYLMGTHPAGGPLPVEAQVLLRVIGEDLPAAKDLLRGMPELDRGILMFYIEQIAGLVYEIDETET